MEDLEKSNVNSRETEMNNLDTQNIFAVEGCDTNLQ